MDGAPKASNQQDGGIQVEDADGFLLSQHTYVHLLTAGFIPLLCGDVHIYLKKKLLLYIHLFLMGHSGRYIMSLTETCYGHKS